MSLLSVEHLSHGFADKELYEDASFELNKEDHMGIVGQNGAGKSTLIKILTGETLPDKGRIVWQNKVTYGYLDQYADIPQNDTLYEFLTTAYADLFKQRDLMEKYYAEYAENLDDKLLEKAGRIQENLDANNFYEIDTEINRVMTGLGLDDIGKDHIVSEMSGGQRSKIILAKLLLQDPDVLILDEPTNYLDTAHINWLADYLNGFEGAFTVSYTHLTLPTILLV